MQALTRRGRAARSRQTDAIVEMYWNTTIELDRQLAEFRKNADAFWEQRGKPVARQTDFALLCAHAEIRMVREHRLAIVRLNRAE